MAQEYTVKTWKVWEDEEGSVRDKFGNFKGSVTFEEENSEPVDATFKTEPQPGDKKYGEITEYQTRSGNTRRKFQRKDRPEHNNGHSNGNGWNDPDKQSQIKAQWAIGQACHMLTPSLADVSHVGSERVMSAIEVTAKELFSMVDRVSGLKAPATQTTTRQAVGTEITSSMVVNSGTDFQEDLAKAFNTDGDINLDEIPF